MTGQTDKRVNKQNENKEQEDMQGLVGHFSQLPRSRRLKSRIKPPAQAFTQNGYELQKKAHLCAHKRRTFDSQRQRQYLLQL